MSSPQGGKHMANTWQGEFPRQNLLRRTASSVRRPVTAFPTERLPGLHDMIGNVWEWTTRIGIRKSTKPTPRRPCLCSGKSARADRRPRATTSCQPEKSKIPRKVAQRRARTSAPPIYLPPPIVRAARAMPRAVDTSDEPCRLQMHHQETSRKEEGVMSEDKVGGKVRGAAIAPTTARVSNGAICC